MKAKPRRASTRCRRRLCGIRGEVTTDGQFVMDEGGWLLVRFWHGAAIRVYTETTDEAASSDSGGRPASGRQRLMLR